MRKRLSPSTALWAFAVFALWWSGWQPGFIDADAIDRLSRLRSFDLTTDDPALYTAVLRLISIGGRSAALATLIQGAAWAALAARWAFRLHELGGARPAAGLAVGAVAALPAISVSMLGLWPQSLLALAAVWVLTELAAAEWLYRCADPTALLEDRKFDATAISANRMRSLGFGAFVRHPFSAVGQRICATAALMAPAAPAATRYYLPEYTVFPNTIGVARHPLSSRAFDATKAVLIRTQQNRPPVLVVAPGTSRSGWRPRLWAVGRHAAPHGGGRRRARRVAPLDDPRRAAP